MCQSLRNQKSEVGGWGAVIRSGQEKEHPTPYSPTRPCLKWSCLQTPGAAVLSGSHENVAVRLWRVKKSRLWGRRWGAREWRATRGDFREPLLWPRREVSRAKAADPHVGQTVADPSHCVSVNSFTGK